GLYRFRLGLSLRSQAILIQHVEEVSITAGVELVCAFELYATTRAEVGQYAVRNGGAELGLDVVAARRNALAGKGSVTIRHAGNEYGNAVHKSHARPQGAFGIKARCFFRAHGQVVEHDFSATVFQGVY